MALLIPDYYGSRGLPIDGPYRFIPIIEMLKNPNTTLSFITAGSKKGFMLRLRCASSRDSLYTDIHNPQNKVLDYVLKIVYITPRSDIKLPDYTDNKGRQIAKETESAQSFVMESAKQSQLSLSSSMNSYKTYIPSLSSFALFDPVESFKFLILLADKGVNDPDVMRVINYLIDTLQLIEQKVQSNPTKYVNYRDSKIGILVMSMVDNSEPVAKYISDGFKNNQTNTFGEVYANLIANAVRLAMYEKVLHMDAHANNILVKLPSLNTVTIDFGRISDLKDMISPDAYFSSNRNRVIEFKGRNISKPSKTEMLAQIQDFDKEFQNLRDPKNIKPTEKQKAEFMRKVCDWIRDKDNIGNKGFVNDTYFTDELGRVDDSRVQTHWYDDILRQNSKNREAIFARAFNILVKDTPKSSYEQGWSAVTVSNNDVKRFIGDGRVFGFPGKFPPESAAGEYKFLYHVVEPGAIAQQAPAQQGVAQQLQVPRVDPRPAQRPGPKERLPLPPPQPRPIQQQQQQQQLLAPRALAPRAPAPRVQQDGIGKFKVALILAVLAGCGYYLFKGGRVGSIGGGSPEDIVQYAKEKGILEYLNNMLAENGVCPINITDEQKEAFQKIGEMLKDLPEDTIINLNELPVVEENELPVVEETGGRRRRTRKSRTKKQRKTKKQRRR